jgi:hypothetical protein
LGVSATTDSTGTAVLSVTPPRAGDYQISVSASGYETAMMNLTVQSRESETTVSVEPTQQTVAVDSTTEYDVVVDGIDNGVGAYEFTAALSNASVASITDITLTGTSPQGVLTDVTYGDNNASVSVAAGKADHDNGVIATITIEGQSPGDASLLLRDPTIGSDDAIRYEISEVTNATVIVEQMTAPVVVGESPARDLDSDGTFEDVNGDGSFDIVDVSALFQSRNSQAVTDNGEMFDANDDGSFDIVDISLLFEQLRE